MDRVIALALVAVITAGIILACSATLQSYEIRNPEETHVEEED